MKWIKCNIPFGPIYSKDLRDEDEIDSLAKRKLIQPGVLIKTNEKYDGRNVFLIGHINTLGGVCDDCVMFDRATIIKEYCVVWEGK